MCLERSIQKCVYITKLENKLIYIYIYIYRYRYIYICMNKIITSHFNRIKLKENNNNNNNNNKGIT